MVEQFEFDDEWLDRFFQVELKNCPDEQFEYLSLRLNKELHVIGDFIFDAYLILDDLPSNIVDYENKLYSMYYKASVGVERLQKVIRILQINPKNKDDLIPNIEGKKKNNSLLRHSHQALHDEIVKISKIKFEKRERALLNSLMEFYKLYRYGYEQFDNRSTVRELISNFAQKGVKLSEHPFINPGGVRDAVLEFSKYLSKILCKYMELLNDLIEQNCYFTNECESTSKIYILKHFCKDIPYFMRLRQLAVKELFAYLKGYRDEDAIMELIDLADIADFCQDIISGRSCCPLVDAISGYYSECFEIEVLSLEKTNLKWIVEREEMLDWYLQGSTDLVPTKH